MFLIGGAVAYAQPPEAAPEDLSWWMHRATLTVPAVARGQFVQVPVTPALYGKAMRSLQDVRLVDGDNRVLPYAVVTLNGQTEQALRSGRTFDRLTLPDRSERRSVDLGERPGEHNEITLDVQTRSHGRPVLLEASDDGKSYAKLFEGELVYLTVGGQTIDQRRFSYPASRSRYLRVTLGPDRVDTSMGPILREVQIGYRLVHPARVKRGSIVSVLVREPVRINGESGSAWNLTFPDRLPLTALHLRVPPQRIDRPWKLESVEQRTDYWASPRGQLANGVLRRAADAPDEPLTLRVPETLVQQVRLSIQDARNAPLDLREIEYEYVEQVLVFQAPAAPTELWAYFGNPEAPEPRYEVTLPAKVETLREGVMGARMDNPRYQPPPPPTVAWTERNRWLIDGTTLIALAVLAALLVPMALANLREAAARRSASTIQDANPD
jgi:hypothetical protein